MSTEARHGMWWVVTGARHVRRRSALIHDGMSDHPPRRRCHTSNAVKLSDLDERDRLRDDEPLRLPLVLRLRLRGRAGFRSAATGAGGGPPAAGKAAFLSAATCGGTVAGEGAGVAAAAFFASGRAVGEGERDTDERDERLEERLLVEGEREREGLEREGDWGAAKEKGEGERGKDTLVRAVN